MKPFRQLLAEIRLYDIGDDGGRISKQTFLPNLAYAERVGDYRNRAPARAGYVNIGKVPESSHDIWMHTKKLARGNTEHHIEFHDPAEPGKVDIHMFGLAHNHENGTRTLDVESLLSRGNPSLKADQAYYHLLKSGHVDHIVSRSQTEGGSQKVWQNLADRPDVHIHGIDKAGEPVHVDLSEPEEVYDRWSEPRDPYLADTPKILVAHLK